MQGDMPAPDRIPTHKRRIPVEDRAMWKEANPISDPTRRRERERETETKKKKKVLGRTNLFPSFGTTGAA
jgi:hypothetical protein